MTEGSPQTSIQARIASLNLGHVGRAPTRTATAIGNEELVQRPQFNQRSNSINVAPTSGQHTISKNGIGNEPGGTKRNGVLPPPTITRTGQGVSKPSRPTPPRRLPPCTQSSKPSPSLPPRRPSAHLNRRDSSESLASTVSNISSVSALSNGTPRTSAPITQPTDRGRKMAPVFNPSAVPQLPQRLDRAMEKPRIPLTGIKSTPSATTLETSPPPKLPSLPPRLPSRNRSSQLIRNLSPKKPPSKPAKSALSFGMNNPESKDTTNGVDQRDPSPAPIDSVPSPAPRIPPPVPLASRPDLSKHLASKPKPQHMAQETSCLLCRDFSGPDTHAAKFPRESVPSLDWLATQLGTPFPSLTDKARAIFTWLHHNVAYDVVAFFNNKLKPATPASTLSTGLAVCEGYASLFTAIATKAGLESVVIGGHGKGYGHSTLPPGALVPPQSLNHAWNAVKIDNDEWKLIDSCWGAGNVNGKGEPYNKQFSPHHFITSNNEFGLTHFPSNNAHFLRTDGRQMSWEEYITDDRRPDRVRIFNGVAEIEGISTSKFLPAYLKIPVAGAVHFQFERLCDHWDPVLHGPGKPYVFILGIHGLEGREDDYIPFETDGRRWWADVSPRQLGASGQTVTIYSVSMFGDQSGRGLSVDEYKRYKGRKGWNGAGLAAWELV